MKSECLLLAIIRLESKAVKLDITLHTRIYVLSSPCDLLESFISSEYVRLSTSKIQHVPACFLNGCWIVDGGLF